MAKSLRKWRCSSVQFSHSAMFNSCDPMDCSTTGFPDHHQLPELAQVHVLQAGDAFQPSHPLSSPSPPAFNLSQCSHASFPMRQFFASGGQSIVVPASASVLPVNTQEAGELGSNINLPSSHVRVSSLRSGV